jgi:hypothetical protein
MYNALNIIVFAKTEVVRASTFYTVTLKSKGPKLMKMSTRDSVELLEAW